MHLGPYRTNPFDELEERELDEVPPVIGPSDSPSPEVECAERERMAMESAIATAGLVVCVAVLMILKLLR